MEEKGKDEENVEHAEQETLRAISIKFRHFHGPSELKWWHRVALEDHHTQDRGTPVVFLSETVGSLSAGQASLLFYISQQSGKPFR